MTDDRDNDPKKKTSPLAVMIGVVVIYLIPPIATFIDEAVFRTYFIWNHSPEWLVSAGRTIYFPIAWIVRCWTGR